MKRLNLLSIKSKHKKIIQEAITQLKQITDPEHCYGHTLDVLNFAKRITDIKDYGADLDCLVISIYWHDVGRLYQNDEHESLSARLLEEKLLQEGYDKNFIKKCNEAIRFHRWNMSPKSIEGKILKDADKLSFLGKNRWASCIKSNYKLNEIIRLLPNLKNKILSLDESKKLYDEAIIELVKFLHDFAINQHQ